ncbi:MAG: hypothetical protein HYU99_01760 [Deltaproteobacteria bacterium]|nr:hypothetical protein [Deltaproteobacteria bacterium]
MRPCAVFLLIFTLFSNPVRAQVTCSPEAMDGALASYLKLQVAGQEIRLAIFPFQDASGGASDPTLEKGFALLFYEILYSQAKIGVIHPFLVFNSASALASTDLFADDRIISAAASLGATHAVYGMFQKKGELLRYFVKVADVNAKQEIGTVMEFAAQQNERFFNVAADAAGTILQRVGRKGADVKSLKKFQEQGPTFEAFRYYVKGMEKSGAFREVDLGAAKVWFEKATIASYTFKTAYEEMARTIFMLAAIDKSAGKDPTLMVVEGNQVLERGKLAAGASKKSQLIDWVVGILEGRTKGC